MSEAKRTVLVVDDNPENVSLVLSHLRQEQYGAAFATDANEALSQLQNKTFDLVLLDIMMPGMDGYELCRKIKEMPEYKDIPVLFLTAKGDKQSVLYGFEVGAVDYIVKPFYGPELVSRVNAHLQGRAARERLEEINVQLNKEVLRAIQLEDELQKQKDELAHVNKQLHEMATKDPVTGIANRRHMLSILHYESERAARRKSNFCLVLTDIDYFKHVNDTHGHDCGDHVLNMVGTLLTQSIRQQDQVARWGGEEFLMLLPDTDEPGAMKLAEKLRKRIADRQVAWEDAEISVTMTFGVSQCNSATHMDECLKWADQALYYGKENGRNRTVSFSAIAENSSVT
jgi:diguanylate cyclase (GGDEF)-like protein